MTKKKNSSVLACIVALVFCLSTSQLTQAADWGRFRGPNGNGYSAGDKFPATFKVNEALWKCPLPGKGNSSPVVGGGNVYVTSADPATSVRTLTAIDIESGKSVWSAEFPLQAFKAHKRNGFASSTPCADEKHVYVLWQSTTDSAIHALNHQGKEVWKYGWVCSRSRMCDIPDFTWWSTVVNARQRKAREFLVSARCRHGYGVLENTEENSTHGIFDARYLSRKIGTSTGDL